MPNYRRAITPGGTWFFTVDLLERDQNDRLVRDIALLREIVRRVRARYPFDIDAWVVLPDHLHCIGTLPPGDADFGIRWRLINSGFSRALPKTERRSDARMAAGGARHFWEDLIRDEADHKRHVDHVHVNPLKHGLAKWVSDWPYSTFHRYDTRGVYPADWCGDAADGVSGDV